MCGIDYFGLPWGRLLLLLSHCRPILIVAQIIGRTGPPSERGLIAKTPNIGRLSGICLPMFMVALPGMGKGSVGAGPEVPLVAWY